MDDSSNQAGGWRIGEVIETSSVRVWVEADELNDLPPLGTMVRIGTATGDVVYAVVSFGETAGIDPTRRAARRGSSEVRDEEVYRRHPELARILRSTFEAVPVAFCRGGNVRRVVPAVPPPLHYSVETVTARELDAVTSDPRYLSLLAAFHGEVPVEQLIAAHLRAVFEQRGRDEQWLDRAAEEVARIFKQDYDRLLPILEAVDPES